MCREDLYAFLHLHQEYITKYLSGKCIKSYRKKKKYSRAPVSMGNMFQELPWIIPNTVYNMIFHYSVTNLIHFHFHSYFIVS
jgi:hypothetical protein